MSSKERIIHIDALRAIAIIGVMVVHTLALFLGPSSINALWNYLEFVVITFVLCSGYVTWRSFESNNENREFFRWFLRRFVRLYGPYAIYVISYATLVLLLPNFVKGRLITLSPSFFVSSATLTGGADVGWLVILFLQLSLITPVSFWLMKEPKRMYTGLALFGLFALALTVVTIPTAYSRAVAWLPWSFVYLLGMIYANSEKNKPDNWKVVLAATIGAVGLWVILRMLLIQRDTMLTFTLHKYPPDLYYLSYGVAATGLLVLFVRRLEHAFHHVSPFISFVSQKSYGMFFIHLIVLDILITSIKYLSLIPALVLSVSLVFFVCLVWDTIRRVYTRISSIG